MAGSRIRTIVVDTDQDVVASDDGQTSLREALALAEGDDNVVVTFDDSLSGATLSLVQGQLELDDDTADLTIDGDLDDDGIADITLDAGGASRVLEITGKAGDKTEVTLDGLTITGGRTQTTTDNGGGINAEWAELTIRNSVIDGNRTIGDSESGSTANTPFAQGGGLHAINSDVEILGTRITNNIASGDYGYGGGIAINEGTLHVADSSISNNTTYGYFGVGAGMLVLRSDSLVERSTIDGNIAHGVNADGAGIAIEFGNFDIVDSAITNNITTGVDADGGGIASVSINLNIVNSTLAGNQILGDSSFGAAIANGGTIPGRAANMTVSNSTFTGNYVANGGGGAIAVYGIGLTKLENNIFAGNAVGFNEFPEFGSGSDVFLFENNDLNGHNIFQQTDVRDLNGDITGVDARDIFAETYEINDTGVYAGVLADNGGPTQTVALRDDPSNPALGLADPETATSSDQRGYERDGAPDAGAVELGAAQPEPALVLIEGGAGRDRLRGGDAAERFDGGAGSDIYVGHGGADQFVLGTDARDIVNRFQDGSDLLDVSQWDISSFDELSIRMRDERVIIEAEGGLKAIVRFEDRSLDQTALSAEDFIFA